MSDCANRSCGQQMWKRISSSGNSMSSPHHYFCGLQIDNDQIELSHLDHLAQFLPLWLPDRRAWNWAVVARCPRWIIVAAQHHGCSPISSLTYYCWCKPISLLANYCCWLLSYYSCCSLISSLAYYCCESLSYYSCCSLVSSPTHWCCCCHGRQSTWFHRCLISSAPFWFTTLKWSSDYLISLRHWLC